MNAERLHVIAKEVDQDLAKTKTLQTLKKLIASLEKQVQQPNQAGPQQEVARHLQLLSDTLPDAPSNEFSPAWQDALGNIGVWELLGDRLLEKIHDIFQRHQITPAAALEELKELHNQVEQIQSAIKNVLSAFQTLEIGSEDLDPGQAEVGFLIPRSAVKNELGALGAELRRLERILRPFSEVATGSRPAYPIRTISSSEFTVLLDLVPKVGACLAVAVERVVAIYKKLLEIKKLRAELREQGVDDARLEGIDAHAETHMKDGIDPLVPELLEAFGDGIDEGRKRELTVELTHALNEIANRIDKGYNVEIRIAPPEPEAEDEEGDGLSEEERAQFEEYITTIRKATETLEFVRPKGGPLLALRGLTEENDNDEEGAEE